MNEFDEGCNTNYILSHTLDNITYPSYTLIKMYEENSQLDIRERIYTTLKRQFIDENFNYTFRRPPIKLWKKQ
jgi:hypothetical protein